MTGPSIPRVLSIAGTDPTGGAGMQADLKSISALGGYAMGVVTVLVAQNTHGVTALHVPPLNILDAQLRAVSDDVAIDAVKIGMLHSTPIIDRVGDWLTAVRPPIVVLDPVMVATSGDRLLDRRAEESLAALCRSADLVTPNLPELGVLAGRGTATTWADALAQAQSVSEFFTTTVLLKGGHLVGESCPDAIVSADGIRTIPGRRIQTHNTHGTGCSLSSAMATLRAEGLTWPDALARAKAWLTGALEHADDLHVGTGNGPIDHFHEHHGLGWTGVASRRTAATRAAARGSAFVRRLADGTLDRACFDWYLVQDALYLRDYSRVLARASALAPEPADQVFWAQCAASAIQEESELHRAHVGNTTDAVPAPATVAYVEHLLAASATASYGQVVAAVLPCFTLYAEIGATLAREHGPGHPFADWLATYSDPVFAEQAEQARAIAERAASAASVAERRWMDNAHDRSMDLEVAFFDAPFDAPMHRGLAGHDRAEPAAR